MKNICKIKIFYDSLYFEEVAIEFHKSIQENYKVHVDLIHILDSANEKNQWNESLYFCFGMHKWMDMRNIPPYFVVMQLEPLVIRGLPNERYLILLNKSIGIFEYSRLNFSFYKEFNIPKSKLYLFEIGKSTSEQKDIETSVEKDIDILFIGNMTEYRTIVMQKIKKMYLQKNIQTFDNLWGDLRDMIMMRSKIILNIHSEGGTKFPLETPRLLYSYKFPIHIVSESSGDITEESRWMNRVHFMNGDLDFNIFEKIFSNNLSIHSKILNKVKKSAPKIGHKFGDMLKKYDIDISMCQNNKIICPIQKRWFDIDSLESNNNIFEKLNLDNPNLPNITTYDIDDLPNVSIITLTTQERLLKWKKLMKWNNDNRVYNKSKLEWIVVVDKPTFSNHQTFENIKVEMEQWDLKPTWLIYENTKQDIPYQITEKRNLAVEICKNDYIDCMDDDDIEIPDALKIKMIAILFNEKKCAGSSSLMCLDLKKQNMFVKKAFFPTESSLTFHKSFWKNTSFVPNIHGECFTMVMSQASDIIDVPSSLNLIAITHSSNITGLSRTFPNNTINHICDKNLLLKNLKNFLGDNLTLELMNVLY